MSISDLKGLLCSVLVASYPIISIMIDFFKKTTCSYIGMSHEQLNLKIDSEVAAKLRKYFPGQIGALLEQKARELIAEMEEAPKPIAKSFQIYEDGPHICYAPQKFMDRKQYLRLTSTIPHGVEITSELIVSILSGKIQAYQAVPSKKGTWPGKVSQDETIKLE